MVPELATCDQCGRTVIVLSWENSDEDTAAYTTADDSHRPQIDCKIDCPTCGTRVQSIELIPTENRN